MGENKIAKYGFWVSIFGLIIAFLALIRDYFDFKQNPEELGNYFSKGSSLIYITLGLLAFIIGYLFHKYIGLDPSKNIISTIKDPKILIAYTDVEIFENDQKIISNSKLSKSVTPIPNITVDKLRETLSNNEYDIVHLGIPIDNDGEVRIDNDKLSSAGLMNLLGISKTQLLVLGSCNSVNLAADTVNSVNMIAATANLDSMRFEKWEEMFYSFLSEGYTLTKSFNIAKTSFQDFPITMILKQDIKFKVRR